jgi:2-hydroxychromene-2-carboxylate isomerase
MPQPRVDFWFDFASTYSYVTIMRIEEAARAADVEISFRPFLLGPVFKAQGWDTSPFNIYEAKGRYMWRDMERLCAALKLPLRRPDPFPQNSLLAARVALIGLAENWGQAFCRNVFEAEFASGRRIDDPAVIAELLRQSGCAVAQTFERTQSEENKQRLRAHTEEAQQLGIFGAPSFVTADGELFWGNDRLEQALTWARQYR